MKTSKSLLSIVTFLLNAAWYIYIVLAIIALGVLTLDFSTNNSRVFSARVKYPLSPEIVPQESLSRYANNIRTLNDEAFLKMDLNNTLGQIFMVYFFYAAFVALTLIIIYQLRKFFGTIQKDTPFRFENIRRLKITALCFALLTLWHVLIGVSTWLILKQHVKDFNNMHMVWSENFIGLILGTVIYIMADVFKYGFELKKENEEFV